MHEDININFLVDNCNTQIYASRNADVIKRGQLCIENK